jgi:hypothetical protein
MATRFTDHTATGTAAARPAASAVPQGALYFATDTLVISKSDGVSTWTTVMTAAASDATLATTDITTNDVSSTKHGFAPKSPADATKFMNGAATPAYALVKDSDLSTSDITTNDVSTSKHGLAPKAPNDATQVLLGTGAFGILAVLAVNTQTGTTYTLVLTDAGKVVTLSNASGITLTVPTNASVAYATGTTIALAQLGAGQVTVAGAGGVTVSSRGAALKIAGQYGMATLLKTGTDAWILSGDITT